MLIAILLISSIGMTFVLRALHWYLRVIFSILSLVIYFFIGDFKAVQNQAEVDKEAKALAKKLESTHGAAEVLAQMKLMAETKNDSAEAWFWYGRIAAGTHHYDDAELAFSKAYALDSSLVVGLQYANALIAHRGIEARALKPLMVALKKDYHDDRHLLFLEAEVAAMQNKRGAFQSIKKKLNAQPLTLSQKQSLEKIEQGLVDKR